MTIAIAKIPLKLFPLWDSVIVPCSVCRAAVLVVVSQFEGEIFAGAAPSFFQHFQHSNSTEASITLQICLSFPSISPPPGPPLRLISRLAFSQKVRKVQWPKSSIMSL